MMMMMMVSRRNLISVEAALICIVAGAPDLYSGWSHRKSKI